MKLRAVYSSIAGAMLLFSSGVNAGMYTDDLSRCLVESTTTADKLTLVKWLFAAMSLHPAVKSLASVSEKQIDNANRETARLFMKLLTDTCKAPAVKAVKYEGQVAIQSSFQAFGQVAAGELFSNPNVAAGMGGLKNYLDENKLNQTFGAANGSAKK